MESEFRRKRIIAFDTRKMKYVGTRRRLTLRLGNPPVEFTQEWEKQPPTIRPQKPPVKRSKLVGVLE